MDATATNLWPEIIKQGGAVLVAGIFAFIAWKVIWPQYLKEQEENRKFVKEQLAAAGDREAKHAAQVDKINNQFTNSLKGIADALTASNETVRTEFRILHEKIDRGKSVKG